METISVRVGIHESDFNEACKKKAVFGYKFIGSQPITFFGCTTGFLLHFQRVVDKAPSQYRRLRNGRPDEV